MVSDLRVAIHGGWIPAFPAGMTLFLFGCRYLGMTLFLFNGLYF